MNCDEHYVYAASLPEEPGAHALCVDESPWREEWAAEELAKGSTLWRVTCNQGTELMKEYVKWCETQE